jgi:hypothetical protein
MNLNELLIGVYVNVAVCPAGVTLSPGYEYVYALPVATQTVVQAIDIKTSFECVFITPKR